MVEMTSILPVSFYGYDSVIYLVSALIGFAISYMGFKANRISEKDSPVLLSLAFSILSVGLLTISLTSAYSYVRFFELRDQIIFNPFFDISDLGYWIYFGSSFLAYLLLAYMYLPKKDKSKFLIALPISVSYYSYFNVALFFLIAFVAFRSIVNHFSAKTAESMLVMASFTLLTIYHAVLLFTPFGKIFYVVAHVSLILGFLSLLAMMWRVTRK